MTTFGRERYGDEKAEDSVHWIEHRSRSRGIVEYYRRNEPKSPQDFVKTTARVPETCTRYLKRLEEGYTDKSGASYARAIRNDRGCLIAQKALNRAQMDTSR